MWDCWGGGGGGGGGRDAQSSSRRGISGSMRGVHLECRQPKRSRWRSRGEEDGMRGGMRPRIGPWKEIKHQFDYTLPDGTPGEPKPAEPKPAEPKPDPKSKLMLHPSRDSSETRSDPSSKTARKTAAATPTRHQREGGTGPLGRQPLATGNAALAQAARPGHKHAARLLATHMDF